MGAGGEKPGLTPQMKEQAAAVAAELSGKGPAEGVTEAAPLSEDAEAFAPANSGAVHPKLRQKAAGMSRYATWNGKASLWAAKSRMLVLASTWELTFSLSLPLQLMPEKNCDCCLDLRIFSWLQGCCHDQLMAESRQWCRRAPRWPTSIGLSGSHAGGAAGLGSEPAREGGRAGAGEALGQQHAVGPHRASAHALRGIHSGASQHNRQAGRQAGSAGSGKAEGRRHQLFHGEQRNAHVAVVSLPAVSVAGAARWAALAERSQRPRWQHAGERFALFMLSTLYCACLIPSLGPSQCTVESHLLSCGV